MSKPEDPQQGGGSRGEGAPALDAVLAGNGVLVEVCLELLDRHACQVFLLGEARVFGSQPCDSNVEVVVVIVVVLTIQKKQSRSRPMLRNHRISDQTFIPGIPRSLPGCKQ